VKLATDSDDSSGGNSWVARTSKVSRSYKGLPQEKRRAYRRRRLIAAAVEIYGERGYHYASIKAVCHLAGLTERYFYESFTGSEELLIACYREVTERILQNVLQLTNNADMEPDRLVHTILHAYFATIRCDPKAARVFLVEMRDANPAVVGVSRAALRRIAREAMQFFGVTDSRANELLAIGIIGGINEIALYWAAQDYTLSIEEVIEVALQLCGSFISSLRS
jgi:AcrR family transcriptional regulator